MKTRHKFNFDDRTKITERLKSRDGRLYGRTVAGFLVRLKPLKPWANKSERKQVLRERRFDRAIAKANLAAA